MFDRKMIDGYELSLRQSNDKGINSWNCCWVKETQVYHLQVTSLNLC